jgi:hypothetical protein
MASTIPGARQLKTIDIGKARFMAMQNFSTYLILKFSMDVEYARPEYYKSSELILKLLHQVFMEFAALDCSVGVTGRIQ